MPRLTFRHFLSTPMVKSDIRYRINNIFSIELKNDPKYAVCSRVLRTDIQEHEIRIFTLRLQSPFFGTELQRCLFAILFFIKQSEWSHFRCTCGMFLAQRITLPRLWHEDSFQVWMSVEANAEHVKHFTFVPIGIRPEFRNAWNGREFSF